MYICMYVFALLVMEVVRMYLVIFMQSRKYPTARPIVPARTIGGWLVGNIITGIRKNICGQLSDL